jgi:hypothetical protein
VTNEIAHSREFMDRIAAEVFRGVVVAIQGVLRGEAALPPTTPSNSADSDVMNADEVAAFLGVDRTTAHDFAGRGVIPHQRLGPRRRAKATGGTPPCAWPVRLGCASVR